MIAATIANAFISGGVALLQSNFRSLENKMARKFDQLQNESREIKEMLTRKIL